jgi:hypothetical protein
MRLMHHTDPDLVTRSNGRYTGTVGKRRTVLLCVGLAALLAFGSGCSSDSKKSANQAKSAQAKAKAAKAKRARALALRRRRLAASRLARQRRRAAEALRGQQAAAPPPTVPVTVPVVAPATPAADLAAIQRTFTGLNSAFVRGVASGIVAANAANYWVASGVYSVAQCTKFEADRGEGVVSEAFVVHPETLKADNGWVDPTVGKAPTGRIYSFSVDNTQTLVPTGEKRHQAAVMRASVDTAGLAHLFFHCA